MARPRVPNGRSPFLQSLMVMLRRAERQGQRCGATILLAGLVLGAGVVELSSGPLGQTSRLSLELLILLVLQLTGPMLVTLLAMALLLPLWLEHAQRRGGRAWREAVPVAALVGSLTSLRADLIGELRELLAGVLLEDLLRSTLRASLFLVILCAFSQWRGHHEIGRGLPPALVSSDLLVEGLMLLLGLKLVWIIALDPLKLGGVAG